jgi:hypothetical protein
MLRTGRASPFGQLQQQLGSFMPTGQVLTSWKEIASYMGKGVRTVQRWEAEMELPVRRPAADRHIVLAFPAELDTWARRKIDLQTVSKSNLEARRVNHEQTNAHLQRMRNLVQIMMERMELNRAYTEKIKKQCERGCNGNQQLSQSA